MASSWVSHELALPRERLMRVARCFWRVPAWQNKQSNCQRWRVTLCVWYLHTGMTVPPRHRVCHAAAAAVHANRVMPPAASRIHHHSSSHISTVTVQCQNSPERASGSTRQPARRNLVLPTPSSRISHAAVHVLLSFEKRPARTKQPG